MTRAREWPNVAREARDRAAEEMVAARKDLRYVLRHMFDRDRSELIQRTGLALDHVSTALRHLERVGAETLPE